MSAPVDVRAVLDAAISGVVADPICERRGHRESLIATRAAVAELIAADREYDRAVADHKEIIRRIAERGWYELESDALRKAGERTVRAQARRADALARVGGAP